jgi:tetratricopeptide (TPR) repeat protein
VAEGVLGGLIGGEDEGPEPEAGIEAKLSAEAFAAAVAADQAKYDPGVARATQAFLERQTSLLKSQDDQLNAERAVRLSHLHSQSREGRIRRVGQRIRVAMQIFTALVVTAIALGLGVMVHDAFTSRTVVVEPFDAPPALAARGVSGKVVAAGVLDALQHLRDATRGATKGLATEGAWSSEVKIEVPETGVSIGEIDRLLHQRFGHDLHIDGDLVQTETGALALTVRGDNVPAKTFQGAAGDLDKLTTQAAEYVYSRSQPIQFTQYLLNNRRYADAIAFIPVALGRATDNDQQAEFATSWGNALMALEERAQAVEKFRLAMALKPNDWKAWDNLTWAIQLAEGEEAGWREGRAMLDAVARAPKSKRPELSILINPAELTWDLPLMLTASLQDASYNNGVGKSVLIDGPFIADIYSRTHNSTEAARYMASSDPSDSTTKAEALLLTSYAAIERDDASAAIAPLETYWKAWQADTAVQSDHLDTPCYLGLAYGMASRMSEAEAVFKRVGPWSRCFAFHGDVLEHAGDLAGAEQVWAEGVKVGPDLPLVYLHRGVSELNRGDLKSAETDLSTAHAKAPHFADPLKAWGDLLAREGRWKEALAKYDAALKFAPAWTELHEARNAAAGHGG